MLMSDLEDLVAQGDDALEAVPAPPDLSTIDMDDLAEHAGEVAIFTMRLQVLFVHWAQWLDGASALLQKSAEHEAQINEMKGTADQFRTTWEGRLDARNGCEEA
jgi:hypothetical protein